MSAFVYAHVTNRRLQCRRDAEGNILPISFESQELAEAYLDAGQNVQSRFPSGTPVSREWVDIVPLTPLQLTALRLAGQVETPNSFCSTE